MENKLNDGRIDILSLSKEELENILKDKFSLPSYRASQVYEWLYKDIDIDFNGMSNLPAGLRKILAENFFISKLAIIKKLSSNIDETKKYLFEFEDGNRVESVLMKYEHGYSACISTQVGCRMGCSFCASAEGGLVRNLAPSEMIGQIRYIERDLNIRIGNIVLMGIGEPLDNYDNTVKFLRLVNSAYGLNIGYRHISLSTCGLADKIYELAELDLPITLSVSLHASNDIIRSGIMRINKAHNIRGLMEACRYYASKTKRRISFEYILIEGVNDGIDSAAELAGLMKNMLCHVNLIPMNKISGSKLIYSPSEKVKKFQEILLAKGINATVRRRCGYDINASCGQLRKDNK